MDRSGSGLKETKVIVAYEAADIPVLVGALKGTILGISLHIAKMGKPDNAEQSEALMRAQRMHEALEPLLPSQADEPIAEAMPFLIKKTE